MFSNPCFICDLLEASISSSVKWDDENVEPVLMNCKPSVNQEWHGATLQLSLKGLRHPHLSAAWVPDLLLCG